MSDMDKYHVDDFADNEVQEYHDTPIPKFLMAIYVILPIWGIVWWALYWNGSQGFLDRGYWSDLERAAGTTMITEEPREASVKGNSNDVRVENEQDLTTRL
jgi:hypothetical protein